jgi:hypothetical protein
MSFLGKKFFHHRNMALSKGANENRGKLGSSASPERGNGVKKYKIQKGQLITNPAGGNLGI